MIAPLDPPPALARIEADKAAWDGGFRLRYGVQDGWMCYSSTTASGRVWVAALPDKAWLLALEHPGVAAEMGTGPVPPGPGAGRLAIPDMPALHAALDRAWRLGSALPELPLARFQADTAGMPRTTEAERLLVQRIGQDRFRQALLHYWDGRCAVTGIADTALLRASHIVPWAECASDAQRLDVYNGLLLSALWDAAFDAGLVGFADDGTALAGIGLSDAGRAALGRHSETRLARLAPAHRANLRWHRERHGLR